MLRFQICKGVKYFSANYKYKFQARKFKFEMQSLMMVTALDFCKFSRNEVNVKMNSVVDLLSRLDAVPP